jgi:L-aspartate oxidase
MEADVIVVGGGLAGLTAALHCRGDVLIVSEKDSSTDKAQGGVAAAVGEGDSTSMHARDTLQAGNGLCVEAAVQVLVEDGIKMVSWLKEKGLVFDPDLGRESVHSRNRILHIGDFTGEKILAFMQELAKDVPRENARVKGLLVDNGCHGVVIERDGELEELRAKAVVLASGGFSALYSHTTTHENIVGDGALLAYHAGAELMDLEFVQFHPTVFKDFVLSETLRGEGAIIVDQDGERLLHDSPLETFSSRHLTSRVMQQEVLKGKRFFLDATSIEPEYLKKRFSNIYRQCLAMGADLTRERVPVSPAAHYTMGGVRTGLDARTNVKGLLACGEVACTGVHGSSRLPSNSLLEALVFGARAGRSASIEKDGSGSGKPRLIGERPTRETRNAMWESCGIIRNAQLLKMGLSKHPGELAVLVIKCALAREESRGAHYREDYPRKSEKPMHSLVRIDTDGIVPTAL